MHTAFWGIDSDCVGKNFRLCWDPFLEEFFWSGLTEIRLSSDFVSLIEFLSSWSYFKVLVSVMCDGEDVQSLSKIIWNAAIPAVITNKLIGTDKSKNISVGGKI